MTARTATAEKVAEIQAYFYDYFHTTPEEVAAIKAGEPEAVHAFITRNRRYFCFLANRYIEVCPELHRGENADDYVQQLYLDLPLIIKANYKLFRQSLSLYWLQWYGAGGFYYWRKQTRHNTAKYKPADFLPLTVSCDLVDKEDGETVPEYLLTPEEDTPETLYIKAHETHELTAEEITAALSDIFPPRALYFLQHYLNGTVEKLDKKELQTFRTYQWRIFGKLRQNAALVLDRLRTLGVEIPAQYANAAPIDTAEYEEKRAKLSALARVYKDRAREHNNKVQNERRRRQRAAARAAKAAAQGARV